MKVSSFLVLTEVKSLTLVYGSLSKRGYRREGFVGHFRRQVGWLLALVGSTVVDGHAMAAGRRHFGYCFG